ncbi:MAG: family 78 glycoside hydrolase catalytic domain [Erysipelotrichaceae bacterium]|nr:family 78 glycoside hydrolase catalytic domain [Erysipelotrichaceae bacterium]
MKAIRLMVNDLEKPLPLGSRIIKLSWNCKGEGLQKQYRIKIIDEKEENVIWDSETVSSSNMYCVVPSDVSARLKDRQRLIWNIVLNSDEKEESWQAFEMALLNKEVWIAKWICGQNTDKSERLPADGFKKRIAFSREKDAESIRLYATSLGVYSVSVNGKRLDGYLCPGCSEYTKRLYYHAYEIQNDVLEGKDYLDLEFQVADGWYKGKIGSDNVEYFSGDTLALLAQLEIKYIDGTLECYGTDESYCWSNDGPVRFADLKDGEVYDSTKHFSYSKNAFLLSNVKGEEFVENIPCPEAAILPMIKAHEEFVPELLISPSGKMILDFKQNLSGFVKFNIQDGLTTKDQKITLRLCEVLDKGEYCDHTLKGRVNNLQKIEYICNGENEIYEPDFFYSGFRYALVEGIDTVDPNCFKAIAIYTDIPYESSFECSNDNLNRFVQNVIWSQKSNFIDIPTDCPQREKSGWTGDAQIFAATSTCFANTGPFFRKWLKDVKDCQRDNGMVVDVNPRIRPNNSERDAVNGSAGWADAAIIIPYMMWKIYQDDSYITDNTELMLGWKKYVIRLASDKNMADKLPEGHPLKKIYQNEALEASAYKKYAVESGIHWGEWCEPGFEEETNNPMYLVKPKPEIATAYLHYSMSLLAEMLRHLIEKENKETYLKELKEVEDYARGSKEAYRYYFAKDLEGQNDLRMARYVRMLALGLCASQEEEKQIAEKLNRKVIENEYKVGTGFLSTGFLLQTLAKYGYLKTAYQMLCNSEEPGWLAMVLNGATTVWENYKGYENGHPRSISFNHYSMGSVCKFLFDTVCGIQICDNNSFVIKPQPDKSLSWVRCRMMTVYGSVEVNWRWQNDECVYDIKIPDGTVLLKP